MNQAVYTAIYIYITFFILAAKDLDAMFRLKLISDPKIINQSIINQDY